jgi:DNA-binding IclR family transcriptional regulator
MRIPNSHSEPAKPRQGLTRSVVRSLALLEAIAHRPHGLSSTGLAREVEVDNATAIRLLRTLTTTGYVSPDPQKRYFLTTKLLRLAHHSLDSLPLAEVARPYLIALRDKSEETVHLGILEHERVVYIDKLASSKAVQLVSRLGDRMPVNTTALGKAICASLAPELLDELLKHLPYEARTQYSLVSEEVLRDEIVATASIGYATDNRENEDGVVCVAAAIPDAYHVLASPAAISISGPDFRMYPRLLELGTCCRDTAANIARALGISSDKDEIDGRRDAGNGAGPRPTTSEHLGTETGKRMSLNSVSRR